MSEFIQFSWSSLETLLPLCCDSCNRAERNEDIDFYDLAGKVASAFGVEDVEEFAEQRVHNGLQDGFNQVFEDESAKELANLFTLF